MKRLDKHGDNHFDASSENVKLLEGFYDKLRLVDRGIIRLHDNLIVSRIPMKDIAENSVSHIILIESRESFISTLTLFKVCLASLQYLS
ncbi:MAG: hypothetical protein GX434_01020 [Peptococcaceae bacterium]|nr:hypothetical protein [Peptococcaceae bacterium]